MPTEARMDAPETVRTAWQSLRQRGAPNPQVVASLISVGLDGYLERFRQKFLGSAGSQTFKLILGSNGEGKTHLLLCVRQMALEEGHLVAFVEPKNAGSGSPFVLGQAVLGQLEVPSRSESPSEYNLLRLFRVAVERKRASLEAAQLDAEPNLLLWIEGIRRANLRPETLPRCLATGLRAILDDDIDSALAAAKELSLETVAMPASQQNTEGAALLRSLVLIPPLLGFHRLVLLVDEAEVAIESANQKRRLAFLSLMRFLDDHFAAQTEGGAVVLVACTDDFWPQRLNEYQALKGRVSDPGYDVPDSEERKSLTPRQLANRNKLWVRETFRGSREEYEALARQIVDLAQHAVPGVDVSVQHANGSVLAEVACSRELVSWIKRPFVKALAQLIEDQVDEGQQHVIDSDAARGLFELAKKAIVMADMQDERN